MTCPSCRQEVPAAPFCVRCGEPLENRQSPYPVEGRGYAAAPHEHWHHPRVVSTIFPHLPHADMHTFRLALVAGSIAIVALAAAGLFPLALVVAAAVVPFLMVLYLWHVDLYEDEPLPMLAFTTVWGIGVGIGLGFAARHLTRVDLFAQGPATHTLVWLGIVLPLITVVLTMAGPLLLLPYRSFNDVLDGVTFGGACAVCALGAEAITNSASFLGGGLSAPGERAAWTARLLTLGIALPVLAAGVIGSAVAAFWLRFRAPVRDRRRLGLLGSPWVATPVAGAALVGANVSVIYLSEWATLAVTAALALAGLVLLRRMIHLGLLEEAAEREIGPPVRCSNCGRETPAHTFCAQCGVSLQALPKAGRRRADTRETTPGRQSRVALAVSIGALVAGAIGLASLAIVLVRPSPVRPPCERGRPCGVPPEAPVRTPRVASSASILPGFRAWRSSMGPSLEYDTHVWSVVDTAGNAIVLQAENQSGLFVVAAIHVLPSSVSPQQAWKSRLNADADSFVGLRADNDPAHELLGPEVAYRAGSGATYRAVLDQPPSPSQRTELAFEAASASRVTVVVEAVTNEQPMRAEEASSPFPAYVIVDQLLDSFRWSR
jgi:hypothetical protein